jgi:hypothetical protein
MNKFYFISSLTGGALLIAVLVIQPRLYPLATNLSAVTTTDLTLDASTAGADTNNHARELIPNAVAVRIQITPEESDTQKLIDAIRVALQSGDDANWYRISQDELAQLIKLDPQAAADLALNLDQGFIREQMLRQVAHGWAEQNSTTALAWAAGLTDADDRNSSLTDVCIQMSQTDPAAAITTATQYGLENQPGLFENMMQQWAAKDPAAALGWADQLPAGNERDEVMSSLAFVEAQVSPKDAADLVVYEIPPGSEQEEAAISILHQWALQDFAGASAWADQFQEGPLRDRAEQELDGIAEYRLALNK